MDIKFYLPEMNRDEVKEAVERNALLLIPIATVEQHGPHAPLDTDLDNVSRITIEVARRLNPEPRVVVSVPIWFGPSPFDVEKYPGCVKIRKEVFMEALNDLVEGFLRGGFKKVVLVNGHGGGTERWIPQVIDKLNEKKSSLWPEWQIPAEARVVGFTWFSFLGEFAREELARMRKSPPGSDWHAGDIETALQLYLRPELVDMRKAKRGAMLKTGGFATGDLSNWHWGFIIDGYHPPVEPGEVEGVYGDPTLATRELGEQVFELAVSKIAEFVREFVIR